MLAARFSADPFRDFKLEHQRQPFPPGCLPKPPDQKGRRDIVGKVGNDPARSRAKCCKIQCSRIGLNDFETIRGFSNQLLYHANSTGIDLDGRDRSGLTVEKRPCQAARSGADFHDMTTLKRARQFDNPFGDPGVEEEVLPQRVTRGKIMAVDNGREGLPGRNICH